MTHKSIKLAWLFILLALTGGRAGGQAPQPEQPINHRTAPNSSTESTAILPPARMPDPALNLLLLEGRQALENWEYQKADRLSREAVALAESKKLPPGDAGEAHFFRAQYHFYAGDYAEAVKEMERVSGIMGLDERKADFAERVEKLAELWKGAAESRSAHFYIRWAAPKDVVLAEPSLSALEKSLAVLSGDLWSKITSPVLVEVYPSFSTFSTATGLSEEDLSNSGTIAVCKYRRLMINSPRILVRGYSYQDTLSHELVHFLVYQRWADAVPIWLHEGIAKYEELRWRGKKGGDLTASQKSLLASALRQNELISFDRMHPSFAKLKTPRQGQLAFAEVSSVVGFLVRKGGWPLVISLADELARNPAYRTALHKVTGQSFESFWEEWINYARGLNYQELPGMEISAYEIKKGERGSQEDEDVGEADLAEGGEEWKYARLGDLLRDRKHLRAALVEYERAIEIAPYSPRLLNKLGLAYYLAGEHGKSLDPLRKAVEIYPEFSTTYVNLGRSLFALGRKEEAAAAWEEALAINPFNPLPYPYLIRIYEEKGNSARAKKLAEDYKIISG